MPQTGGVPKAPKQKKVTPPKVVKDPHGQNRRPDVNPGAANPAGRTADRPRATPLGASKVKAVNTAKDIQDKTRGIGKGTDISSPNQRQQKARRDVRQDRGGGETDFQRAKQKASGGGSTSGGTTDFNVGPKRYENRLGPGGDYKKGLPGTVGSVNTIHEADGGFGRGGGNTYAGVDDSEYAQGGGQGGGGTGSASQAISSAFNLLSRNLQGKSVDEAISRGAKKTRKTGQKRSQ